MGVESVVLPLPPGEGRVRAGPYASACAIAKNAQKNGAVPAVEKPASDCTRKPTTAALRPAVRVAECGWNGGF